MNANTAASITPGGTPSQPSGPAQFTGVTGAADNPAGSAVGDGPGIWFGSASGAIWYYPGHGMPFVKVATTPIQSAKVVGPCV